MKHLSILLIEPSFIFREGIKTLLSQMNQDFTIEEVDHFVEDLPKIIRKASANFILINPSMIHSEVIFPHPNGIRIVYVAILSEITDLKIISKFDFSFEITSEKQTLTKLFGKSIEKSIGISKILNNNTLSERENSILKLVALGFTNNEIGGKLFISAQTVMTHRKNITRKLGIKTVSGLTVYAILNNLIKTGER